MSMNRNELRRLENLLLAELVKFYESGYCSAGLDPDRGGIYEHKLAARMGFKLVQPGDRTPPELLAAADALASRGYVTRRRRRDDFPELGIWPTPAGLDRAEYLQRSIGGRQCIICEPSGLRSWCPSSPPSSPPRQLSGSASARHRAQSLAPVATPQELRPGRATSS